MKSLYESSPPKMRPSVVCIADILGYSEMSAEANQAGKGDELLQRLKATLDNAYMALAEEAKVSDEFRLFEVRTFTDNVVAGCPLTQAMDGEMETFTILNAFAEYQAGLAVAGFFVRGGISFGELYVDDHMVFGPALIDAHNLDVQGAPPRLGLAASLLQRIAQHVRYYGPTWTPYASQLLQDATDGTVFLNYLSIAFEDFPDSTFNLELLAAHRREVEKRLLDPLIPRGVRDKYSWVARYHNLVISRFASEWSGSAQNEDLDSEQVSIAEEAQLALEHLIPGVEAAEEPRLVDRQLLLAGGAPRAAASAQPPPVATSPLE